MTDADDHIAQLVIQHRAEIETRSIAEQLADLELEEQKAVIGRLSKEQREAAKAGWFFYARSEQKPPEGSWRVWLYLAGRGAGKTRSGAEWILTQLAAGCTRIALLHRSWRAAPLTSAPIGSAGDARGTTSWVVPQSGHPAYVPEDLGLQDRSVALGNLGRHPQGECIERADADRQESLFERRHQIGRAADHGASFAIARLVASRRQLRYLARPARDLERRRQLVEGEQRLQLFQEDAAKVYDASGLLLGRGWVLRQVQDHCRLRQRG
jgi:hypothetical protein